jgi:hypothetical protein
MRALFRCFFLASCFASSFFGFFASSFLDFFASSFRTGGSSIKKIYKGHSQDPPTLVVKCKETLSRDVTWLRSDAFKKISCGAGLFKMQRFEIF